MGAVLGCSSKEGVGTGITETFTKRNTEGQKGITDTIKSGVTNVAEGVKEGVGEGMAKNMKEGLGEGIANNLKSGITEGLTDQVKDGINSNLKSGAANLGSSVKDKVSESVNQVASDGVETIQS